VVEVEVGAYDLLRAVYPYRGQRIAVIGAESVISGARVLGDVMALPMRYFPAVFEQDIEQTLEKNTGEIDVVVGDAVAYRVACRRAIPGEMVRSGVEAVREAIENAEKICDAIALEREKNSRINAIIEHLREGIVVSDERGEVALLNRAAEQMLGRTRREAVGMPLEGLLDGVGRTTELVDEGGLRRRLLHTAGGIIAAKYIPIVTNGAARGTVVACEDVTRIQELEQEIRRTMAKRGLIARRSFSDIIGESAEIKNAIRLAREYAAVDSTVLLYGESGTGKELFAQSLHNESPRRAGPFVAVNCATLPHDLLESTLFGYEDGAFTGAKKGGSKGLFELAHRGTLFLDEIAEMDLETQAKLLRVLQEREVMRLGGDSIIPVDVRIVASSNQRLIRLVQQGNTARISTTG
ncbi:MAG: sigma 54-interacting transcriptional regulator, partial [Oscillospiraceae bacterium]